MAGFRFLHTSDLHLGKRFGTFPEEIRGRLTEARHAVFGTLARIARSENAGHILLAGDTFDTETPSSAIRVQAMGAMAEDPSLTWWLLPGNHDSLRAEPLWDAIRHGAPPNVRVLDTPAPCEMAPGAVLLPAPLSHRHLGDDPTSVFSQVTTPEGSLRIGLAHGPAQTFHDDANTAAIIAPDRAETAGLAYLALGDWHGSVTLGPRTQYSGTPEFDRFTHSGRGVCLLVEVSPAALPQVTPVPTGQFTWQSQALTLAPGLDPLAEIERVLPPMAGRRDTLFRARCEGLIHLTDRGRLTDALDEAAPGFGYFETDLRDLSTAATAGDLDAIARTGALRAAAEALRRDASDGSRTEADRRIAARALDRMWSLMQGER